jgi:hypothetical protein
MNADRRYFRDRCCPPQLNQASEVSIDVESGPSWGFRPFRLPLCGEAQDSR